MNAVPFDTSKMAQRLEAAGVSGAQAEGAAEALAEALVGTDPATKSDLECVESGVRSDIVALGNSIRSEAAAMETRLLGAIEIARRDMTIKLGGLVIVGVGVLLAAFHYIPPHM
jgi:hypothetical protein